MNKEEIVSEVGNPLLRPLSFIQLAFLITVISSPFVWMWYDWSLAWRVGLTGILGCLITLWIYNIIEKAIEGAVDKKLDKTGDKKPKWSKFKEKLDKAIASEQAGKA